MNLLEQIHQEQITQLTQEHQPPVFKSGDTLVVSRFKIRQVKASKKGQQAEAKVHEEKIKGVCLGKINRGANSSFLLRTMIGNNSNLMRFPLYGTKIEVLDQGVMRQAKPYYLLSLRGKKAKVKSMRDHKPLVRKH